MASTHLEANQLHFALPVADDRSEVILEINTLAFQDKAKRASGNTNDIEVEADLWLCSIQLKIERDEFAFANNRNTNIESALEFEFGAVQRDS